MFPFNLIVYVDTNTVLLFSGYTCSHAMVAEYYTDSISGKRQDRAHSIRTCKEFIDSPQIISEEDPIIGFDINRNLKGIYFANPSGNPNKKCRDIFNNLLRTSEFRRIIDNLPNGRNSYNLNHAVPHGKTLVRPLA